MTCQQQQQQQQQLQQRRAVYRLCGSTGLLGLLTVLLAALSFVALCGAEGSQPPQHRLGRPLSGAYSGAAEQHRAIPLKYPDENGGYQGRYRDLQGYQRTTPSSDGFAGVTQHHEGVLQLEGDASTRGLTRHPRASGAGPSPNSRAIEGGTSLKIKSSEAANLMGSASIPLVPSVGSAATGGDTTSPNLALLRSTADTSNHAPMPLANSHQQHRHNQHNANISLHDVVNNDNSVRYRTLDVNRTNVNNVNNKYDTNFIENHKDKFRESGDIAVVRGSPGAVLRVQRRALRSVDELAVEETGLLPPTSAPGIGSTTQPTTRGLDGAPLSDEGAAAAPDAAANLTISDDSGLLTTPEGSPALNCSSYPGNHDSPGIHLVTLRWQEVGVYFTITAFVIFAGLGKLGFHQLHWLSSKVPESCLLIVLGLLMGILIHFTTHETDPELTCHHHVQFPTFTSQAFFLVLLPPIILESAYSLHDRSFIDNLGTVLIFAVFGTLLNTFIIGPCLYGLAMAGAMGNFNITLTESLVFSSLISAVDPVAVLNIFQDLGVNKGLYFLVFGESLLNDGVTVVVYNTLSVFMEMSNVKATQYVLSVVAFFVVAICGALLGLVYGLLTALVTRATTTVRVVEPLALLGLSYLAYLTAELFHFSGIISLIVCGLVQAHYAFQNISTKSYTCVKYFTKMASATSETIIFMFLGMVLVSEDHVWHTGFVLWTLLLCFVVRFIITLGVSFVANRYRLHAIGMSEQLILAYGGLRGAVAFSLVTMLPPDLKLRDHFVTATLVVILFTVFVQGITIRPLVNWLDVSKRKSGPRQLFEEVNMSVVDHMMAGIEEVLGQHGDFYLREQLRFYNEKYLKRLFVRPTCEAPLKRLFEKIAITEHYAHLYGPGVLIQQQQEQLSVSRQKLLESPYNSKHASVQCLVTDASDNMPNAMVEAIPGVLPSLDSQQRVIKKGGGKVGALSVDAGQTTRVNIAGAGGRLNTANSVEMDAKILRRAISSNPYNQLHYTYNRNLVNADNQELSDHLHRRHEKAKRLTRLASQSSLRPSSTLSPGTPLAQEPPPPSMGGTSFRNTWIGTGAAKTSSTASFSGETRGPPLQSTALTVTSAGSTRYNNNGSNSHLLQRRDTITMTVEDMDQLRRQDLRRQGGWGPAGGGPERMASLPGEATDQEYDEVANLPAGAEILAEIRQVNALIDCHRRRSAFRQSRARSRTQSESVSDSGAADLNEVTDPLLPGTVAPSSTGDNHGQSGTQLDNLPTRRDRPPYLMSFSTPETPSIIDEEV